MIRNMQAINFFSLLLLIVQDMLRSSRPLLEVSLEFHFLIIISTSIFFLGAQIIDMMLLVIDVTKGIQTQTAECLIIGEITCDRMMIVLNKIDLIPPEKRQSTMERVCKF